MRPYRFDPESFPPPGGRFPGAPSGRDRSPAWLEKGEYVVPRAAAETHRGLLEAITALHGGGPVGGGPVPHMAKGGLFGGKLGNIGRRLRGAFSRRAAKGRKGRVARHRIRGAGQGAAEATRGSPLSVFGEGASAISDAMSGDEVGAAKKGIKMFTDRVQGAFNPQNKLQAAGDAAGAVGIGGMAAVPGAGPIGIFAEVTLKAADKLKEFSNQLHESNVQFKEFSGSMAAVAARQEARDIVMSMGKGEDRARSAEYLASGKNQLEQATAPIENTMANAQNMIGGVLDRAMAKFLEYSGIVNLFRAVGYIIDLLTPEGEQTDPFGHLTEAAAEHDRKFGRPPHLP